ncbi:hypothetical protein MJO10_30905, partial [Salmonella enterica subsp. enterica serovar Anatum]|nr:hypothetical protein [Salmonella enterica subsp. enterica serovar Anatum]
MLAILASKSRDNSRTPMQWDNGKNAGFTQGEPWISLCWQPLLHDLTNEGLAFGHELAQALRKMHAATSDALEDDGFLFQ